MATSTLKRYAAFMCVMILVASASWLMADDQKPVAVKDEPPVVCRLSFGDIFKAMNEKQQARFVKECGLELKQVVKAFDECKVVVAIKQRGQATDKAKRAADGDLELTAKGKREFVLKDASKEDVALNVKEIQLLLNSVEIRYGPLDTAFISLFTSRLSEMSNYWDLLTPCRPLHGPAIPIFYTT